MNDDCEENVMEWIQQYRPISAVRNFETLLSREERIIINSYRSKYLQNLEENKNER